jgi:hypothetical protein
MGKDGRETVLLFYDGYEIKAREPRSAALFHAVRSQVRFAWGRLCGKHNKSGFYVAFMGLRDALVAAGHRVRINDFRAARANPSHPIGIAGYPSVFEHVQLPNPVIFGPGDPGHPDAAGRLAARPTIRRIIQPSEWYVDLYRQTCGDKMLRCPIGIDLAEIPDARDLPKSIDVLIYDKIRWYRDTLVDAVRERLIRHLDARGLTHATLVYEHHTKSDYFAHLRRARSMAFLCEHETQGLACEEALAMSVPVFAWDEGRLVDPLQRGFAPPGLAVSSVPYFDDRCGARFTLDDMEPVFDRFWAARDGYAPRDYIAEALSPEETATIYMGAYRTAA